MSTVYLARGHCANYYCGCGGGHLLAIAGTEEEAKTLAAQATGTGTYFDFTIKVTGPFTVGELTPEESR